jgi:signal transduction histidine kinase
VNKPRTHTRDWGPDLVGYFTLISVAIGAIVTLPESAPLGLVILDFVLIAALMTYRASQKPIRNRLLYLAAFTLLSSAFFLLRINPGIYHILFFIISAQAMMLLPVTGALSWLLLLAVISGAAFMAVEGVVGGLLTMVIYSGGYFFFGFFGRSLLQAQEAKQRSDELLQELQLAHAQLQEHMLQVEQLAVAEERNRLAREMHDALGHRLTVASVQLEGAQRLIDKEPHKAEDMIATVRDQVREALNDLRHTVATLREPLESGMDFPLALKRLIIEFEEATGTPVNIILPDPFPKIPDTHHFTLYRSAQEALTNVQRHANAKQVWVQVDAGKDAVKLSVGDDGKGLLEVEEGKGFGLRGMRERAAQLGGECLIEGRTGGGAQVTLTLPLEVKADGS